ncbi:hypothetical protein GCM10027425_06010 [Alteromonas gracilis]
MTSVSGGPPDPAARQQWRAARREAARRHHPDLGGDAEALQRALGEVDARFGVSAPRPARIVVVRRTPLARRVLSAPARGLARGARLLQAALPRTWPGSRRYHDI